MWHDFSFCRGVNEAFPILEICAALIGNKLQALRNSLPLLPSRVKKRKI
jgi:hypothetical protein